MSVFHIWRAQTVYYKLFSNLRWLTIKFFDFLILHLDVPGQSFLMLRTTQSGTLSLFAVRLNDIRKKHNTLMST